MNAPDPTTPGARAAPTALGSAVTNIVGGSPLAILTVWLIDTWGTAKGQPLNLNAESGAAIGAVGAGVFTYFIQIALAVRDVILAKLHRWE